MDSRRRFSVLLGVIALVAVSIMFFWGGPLHAPPHRELAPAVPTRQVEHITGTPTPAEKRYDGVRLSRPLADLVEAVPADVDVLAVKDDEGRVYCTDLRGDEARLCLLEGQTLTPIWGRKVEDGRRLELAGVRGNELILVFHEGLAYIDPLQAWAGHDTFYGFQPSDPGRGVYPQFDLEETARQIAVDLSAQKAAASN